MPELNEIQPPEELKVEKKEEKESPLLADVVKSSEMPEKEQIVITKDSFLDRFLLKLSIEEKAIINEHIVSEMGSSPLYWVLLVISVIIATLGLLQNSVAIIIGAMLIAPLLRPIKGLAFGITTGQPRYFWMAVKMLILSIVISVLCAFGVSLLVPLKIETSEIIARTVPNLLDLLIAVAAGVIAILSLYFKKLSENIAGVAMAAAIMPPLAVTGIEISLHNNGAVLGSFFLFVTNLFAILAVGVMIFLLFGFYPSERNLKHRSIQIGAMLFTLLLFISFPLWYSLRNLSDKINVQAEAYQMLNEAFLESSPLVKLDDFKVEKFDSKMISFSGKLQVPSGSDFVIQDQEALRQKLSKQFAREVDMEFDVVPIVSITSKK